jgi:hypothetical protein
VSQSWKQILQSKKDKEERKQLKTKQVSKTSTLFLQYVSEPEPVNFDKHHLFNYWNLDAWTVLGYFNLIEPRQRNNRRDIVARYCDWGTRQNFDEAEAIDFAHLFSQCSFLIAPSVCNVKAITERIVFGETGTTMQPLCVYGLYCLFELLLLFEFRDQANWPLIIKYLSQKIDESKEYEKGAFVDGKQMIFVVPKQRLQALARHLLVTWSQRSKL